MRLALLGLLLLAACTQGVEAQDGNATVVAAAKPDEDRGVVRLDAIDFARLSRLDPDKAQHQVGRHYPIFTGRVQKVDTADDTVSVLLGRGKDVVELFPASTDEAAARDVRLGTALTIECLQVIAASDGAQGSGCTGFVP